MTAALDFLYGLGVLSIMVLSWPPTIPFLLCCARGEQIPDKGNQLHEGYEDTMPIGGG